MLHDPPKEAPTIGADLRALRKSRGLTLADLAAAMGRSVGWVSQVERDISEPSISDLRAFAEQLDVSVSSLFRAASAPGEDGYIVRKDARRPIGSREAGLVEALLSPALTDDFEVVLSTFEAGAILPHAVTRPTQELGYVIAGRLNIWISDRKFVVRPGDSFRIRNEPHRWENPYDEPCQAIWVISPPIY